MADGYVCWRCGTSLADLPMPLARVAECTSCRADLHVCRLCEYYDKRVAKACREPVAEEVQDKQRANFCGYFQIKAGAYREGDERASHSERADLEALFGGSPGGTAVDNKKPDSRPAADDATERLERLFGGKGEL